MRRSALPLAAAAAAVLAVTLTITSAQEPEQEPRQAPAGAPPQGVPGQPPREFPAPTNLKVLPKTLTGKQVRDIMEQWQGQLGVHCDTCHKKIPGKVGPNGWPQLDFPDDSKPEKNAARLMYTMTQKINDDYISMVDMDHGEESNEDHDHKVTCGTCHRGHQHPEAYIPPPEHQDHHPPAPAGQPPLPR